MSMRLPVSVLGALLAVSAEGAPTLQLTSPAPYDVAHPFLEIAGICADDQPDGCQQLDVEKWANAPRGAPPYQLYTTIPLAGPGPFQETLDLTDLDGFHAYMLFTAKGASGASRPVNRSIAVTTNPRLVPEFRTPGDIAASDGVRALVYGPVGWEIASRDGGSEVVPFPFGYVPWITPYTFPPLLYAVMTPRGAIARVFDLYGYTSGYLEWTGSALVDLQTPYPPSLAGDWVATLTSLGGGAVLVRNRATGEQWSDPGAGSAASGLPFVVTEDGTVFVTRPCSAGIGCVDRMTADGGHTILPVGTPRLLYSSGDHVVFATASAVGRISASGAVEICDQGDFNQVGGPWYWMGYAGPSDPIGRVCDEDGGVQPLHPYGTAYSGFAISPDRGVILFANDHRYLADPIAPPLDLGRATGLLGYSGGHWTVTLANTIFRLSLDPDAGSTPPVEHGPGGCSCGTGGIAAVGALLLGMMVRRRAIHAPP